MNALKLVQKATRLGCLALGHILVVLRNMRRWPKASVASKRYPRVIPPGQWKIVPYTFKVDWYSLPVDHVSGPSWHVVRRGDRDDDCAERHLRVWKQDSLFPETMPGRE